MPILCVEISILFQVVHIEINIIIKRMNVEKTIFCEL